VTLSSLLTVIKPRSQAIAENPRDASASVDRGGYIMNSTAFVSNTQLVLAKSASVHGTEMAICVLTYH